MTDREIMQQALEALEDVRVWGLKQSMAIRALRERLEQPVQEPVAWFDKELNTFKWRDGLRNCDLADQQPLHIAPQPTHQESVRNLLISAASMAVVAERQGKYEGASWVADAVLERAQPAQQPLTVVEIMREWNSANNSVINFARAIEAKLREKNA